MSFSCPCVIAMQTDPECPVHGRESIGTRDGIRRRIANDLFNCVRDDEIIDRVAAGVEYGIAALLERLAVDLDDRGAAVYEEYRRGDPTSPRRADPTVLGESNGLEIAAETVRSMARNRNPDQKQEL